jgi:hypothetical protein
VPHGGLPSICRRRHRHRCDERNHVKHTQGQGGHFIGMRRNFALHTTSLYQIVHGRKGPHTEDVCGRPFSTWGGMRRTVGSHRYCQKLHQSLLSVADMRAQGSASTRMQADLFSDIAGVHGSPGHAERHRCRSTDSLPSSQVMALIVNYIR